MRRSVTIDDKINEIINKARGHYMLKKGSDCTYTTVINLLLIEGLVVKYGGDNKTEFRHKLLKGFEPRLKHHDIDFDLLNEAFKKVKLEEEK